MVRLKRESIYINYERINSEDPCARETLIFIHGVGHDMHSWDFILPYIRKNYHIIRYDLRGHGESDAGSEQRTVKLISEDLIYLISELNVQSYHLIGQGLGGFVGVQIAAQRPKYLKTLVLIGAPIHYPKQLGVELVRKRKELVKKEQSMIEMGQELVNKICYPPTKRKIKTLLNGYEKVSPEVYFELFHTGFGEEGTKNLQKINVPILILSGSEDTIFPPELCSASLYFNSNARYLTVPYASFMIQMDQPKITAEWIHKFIQRNNNQNKYINLPEDSYQKNLTSQIYAEIRGIFIQVDSSQSTNEIQVDIMNGFKVAIKENRIVDGWGKRKAKQILVYLVIQPSATRDELCDIFWPDVHLENARNRLRVSLHHLKQLLENNNEINGEPILGTDREHIFLRAKVSSDLLTHINGIKSAHLTEDINKKIGQYKNLLIGKTENALSGLYEEWFLDFRNWIEQQWIDMSLFLVDVYEQRKDYKNAMNYMEIALKYSREDSELSKRFISLKKKSS
ncbi:alpha/beta fold hydrolase [Aquibacillus halophilus]|uniref:Alpha/beta fold hydrolase n=1 Tax=Aquibacillus halophilus TaxID=930132 RepID=A0A6A8DB31_9BACI|nr:alpha/beta hydrolase [Aquibacillus halophilus]MRH41756.1 alpha/beta fold hydrolase [Aquibacillus halophilus]